MASQNDDAPWKAIAARKQAYRLSQIPKEWMIPKNVIPQDPPTSTSGPQNVLSIPNKFLTSSEVKITESYTVPTLLSAISNKRLTATEVTKAFCHRAAIAHQLTNCITEPLFKSAIERAEYLDNHLKQHGPIGPLHGLPVSVKDSFNIAGVDSTIGLAALCFKPATSNAPLVDLLLSLGCVIIAKTNVPQTLASLDSINNVFGRTMNPINRQLTAGGSSGGEGVIVAMKGSMIGFGTDIGGSIRIPAMCNGIYGFKPSVGRIPYEGQQGTTANGISRTSVQSIAGPLARSIEDINTVMREIVPISKNYGEDCFHATWSPQSLQNLKGSGPNKEYTIGILTSDGNCTPLPPIQNLMTELHANLNTLQPQRIKAIRLPTPKAWTKSQSLMSKIMSVEGGAYMSNLLKETSEPLVPWMSTRFRTGPAKSIPEVAAIQAQRSILERQMLTEVWTQTDPVSGLKTRRLDAIICPLAPHPVPEIERYNAVGYTSSWVLFDAPAACVPVRTVVESDLELGKKQPGDDKGISSWDVKCREIWDETKMDRKVYLGSPLCVQVVVPKGEDEALITAMEVVEEAVKKSRKDGDGGARKGVGPKL